MSTSSDAAPPPLATLAPAPLGLRVPGSRARIDVSGPDAADFLQRLSSQDVEALAVGDAAPAAFLNPKGRLVAAATVARLGDEQFVVLAEAGVLATLAETLDRYHFSERLELGRPAGGSLELVGDGAWAAAGIEATGGAAGRAQDHDDGPLVVATERFGVERVVAFGSEDELEGWRARLDGPPPTWSEAWSEVWRIREGDLRHGVDAADNTLGLEAFLDDHVSLTKGCYTGQEIVARIHTYGHVNRRLVLLRIEGEGPIDSGTRLCETDEGDPVGRVTSAADVPGAGFRLALGYVPNAFVAPGSRLTLGEAGGAAVQVLSFEPA